MLVVDLDGTLVRSDSLHELALSLLRHRPWAIVFLPFWLVRGRAWLKAQLARLAPLNVSLLPYNTGFIEWLRGERDRGRRLVLCTGADYAVAKAVADHVGIFDQVLASDGSTNNTGDQKRLSLDHKFGTRGYDYAGNARADLVVWAGAREAIVVNASNRVTGEAKRMSNVTVVFPAEKVGLGQWVRAVRLHQWLKNLLVFVPLIAAHQVHDMRLLTTLVLALCAFGLCASSVYIANDLIDLDSDRQHPRKRLRPFASGSLPLAIGVFLSPVLLVLSLFLAAIVGMEFLYWVLVYFFLTCVYSLWLKRLALVDCLLLAGLYTLRIIAGAAAVSIALSFWLLAFSVFIFFSLAFVKRYAELQVQTAMGNTHAHGRGYQIGDAPLIQTLGVASGYAAVLVLALYLHGETVATLYSLPEMIWIAVPALLFWVSWVWLKAHRGEMHDDPIVFAVKDPVSLLVAVLLFIAFALASVGLPS